jgi:hypothetical protein
VADFGLFQICSPLSNFRRSATKYFYGVSLTDPLPTPKLEEQVIPFCLGHPLRPVWHGSPHQ